MLCQDSAHLGKHRARIIHSADIVTGQIHIVAHMVVCRSHGLLRLTQRQLCGFRKVLEHLPKLTNAALDVERDQLPPEGDVFRVKPRAGLIAHLRGQFGFELRSAVLLLSAETGQKAIANPFVIYALPFVRAGIVTARSGFIPLSIRYQIVDGARFARSAHSAMVRVSP